MVVPVKVVAVTAISVGALKFTSFDFCHLTTLPVFPAKVKSAGEVPEQIVCAEETVPPTETGVTVTVGVPVRFVPEQLASDKVVTENVFVEVGLNEIT